MANKIFIGIILFVIVGVLIVWQFINNTVVELYSPDWVSNSIAEANANGVFVSQPILKNKGLSILAK